MGGGHHVNATEFKAKCLDMIDREGSGEWESLAIPKGGKVVAVVTRDSAILASMPAGTVAALAC